MFVTCIQKVVECMLLLSLSAFECPSNTSSRGSSHSFALLGAVVLGVKAICVSWLEHTTCLMPICQRCEVIFWTEYLRLHQQKSTSMGAPCGVGPKGWCATMSQQVSSRLWNCSATIQRRGISELILHTFTISLFLFTQCKQQTRQYFTSNTLLTLATQRSYHLANDSGFFRRRWMAFKNIINDSFCVENKVLIV